jgi:hypothetical protein
MNNKNKKTLKAVFSDPVPVIAWTDLVSLLQAIGARRVEGEGSRVKFICGAEVWSTHKQHPGKEAKVYQVRSAREFLKRIMLEG